MRFAWGIAAGMAVGFFAGWWLASDDTGRARAVRRAEERSAARPVAAREGEARPPGPLAATDPAGSVAATGGVVAGEDGEIVAAAAGELPGLGDALARARRDADWGAYWKTLLRIGALGTSEAHALLVSVMGDETLRFHAAHTGRFFFKWLSDSSAPGLLEAARRRAEIEIADSRGGDSGWLSLVARFGGAREIAWVESLGAGGSRQREVYMALASGSANPLVAARYAELVRGGTDPARMYYLRTFAEANPRAAYEVAMAMLPVKRDTRLIDVVGRTATADTLPRTRAVLMGLSDAHARFEAIGAVQKMKGRGLDVSGFGPLIDGPRSTLERLASVPLGRDEHSLVRGALRAIRSNSVTWDEATLAAVQPFTSNPDRGIAKEAAKAAKVIARKKSAGDDGWDPERSPGG